MSDLVGNPEDRFSRDAALIIVLKSNYYFHHVQVHVYETYSHAAGTCTWADQKVMRLASKHCSEMSCTYYIFCQYMYNPLCMQIICQVWKEKNIH